MKLMDKLVDKCIQPKGFALKEYKKYKESNSKNADKLVDTVQKQVDKFLADKSLSEDLIMKIKYKRDAESEELVDLFSSDEFGHIIGELSFGLRVYAYKEIYGKISIKRRKSTVDVLNEIKDFTVYYTLIVVNDITKTGKISWNGKKFEGTGTDTAITIVRYITDYLDKIKYLAQTIASGNKAYIQGAVDRFDVQNVRDYEVSPFKDFPNKYDEIIQRIREEENNNELNN